jgi:hypothetical protein
MQNIWNSRYSQDWSRDHKLQRWKKILGSIQLENRLLRLLIRGLKLFISLEKINFQKIIRFLNLMIIKIILVTKDLC